MRVLVVQLPVGVTGQGDGFREQCEGFRFGCRSSLDEDDFGRFEHAGVHVGGQSFDGGDDGAGLFDADQSVRQCGGELGEDRVGDAAGWLHLGVDHFRGVHPGPGVRGGDRQRFPEQRDGGGGPEPLGGAAGVDFSGQPDLRGVPEAGQALHRLRQRKQVELRDLPELHAL